jgi:hypothetical protein
MVCTEFSGERGAGAVSVLICGNLKFRHCGSAIRKVGARKFQPNQPNGPGFNLRGIALQHSRI